MIGIFLFVDLKKRNFKSKLSVQRIELSSFNNSEIVNS